MKSKIMMIIAMDVPEEELCSLLGSDLRYGFFSYENMPNRTEMSIECEADDLSELIGRLRTVGEPVVLIASQVDPVDLNNAIVHNINFEALTKLAAPKH